MKRLLTIMLVVMVCLPKVFGQTDSVVSAPAQQYHVGDVILIKKEATKYLTGETPSRWVYFVKHTVMRVGSKRFPDGLLLRGILSWIGPDDVMLIESTDTTSLSDEQKAEQQQQLHQLAEEIEQLSESEKAALARYAAITQTEVVKEEKPEPVVEPEPEPVVELEPVVEPEPIVEPVVEQKEATKEPFQDVLLIKTNLLYDLATVANLGLEIGFKGKYSFDLPFMYSPYTTHDKYRVRTFTAQPEFRYWFDRLNHKHFIGVHGIVSLFNVSAGESMRFQTKRDDEGHYHPLLGIGVSYGYAWFLDKKEHWCMEVTVGVGYAYIQYDKFYNVESGARCEQGTRHYGGLTKLGLNIAYRFDTAKKDKEKKNIEKD